MHYVISMKKGSLYRPDIDGLRAISILLVIGFHYFPELFHNGFLGVDVFFVISGYLITGIIIRDLSHDSFKIAHFYIRRVLRIFPALLIVLITSIIFGWFFLTANEYKQLTQHISGATIFVSNFLLWNEVDYFDNDAYTKPLLHLWSLAIEEQFYLIWPIVLISIQRFSQKITFILLLSIFSASIILQIALSISNPTAAFYFPLARSWELMAGSILAYITLNFKFENWLKQIVKIKHSISLLGVFLLFLPILLVSNSSLFYSGLAFIPIIGVTLIIGAGPEAFLNKIILKNKLLVCIGLISYPLYLWHWVLLSMKRIIEGSIPNDETKFFMIGASFILAIATYLIIEKPIRFANNRNAIAFGPIIGMILTGCFGYYSYKNDGFKFRENESYFNAEKSGDIGDQLFYKYIFDSKFFPCKPVYLNEGAPKWNNLDRCRQSKARSSQDIAIIGDSHGEHLFIGLAESLPNSNVVYYTRGTMPSVQNTNFQKIIEYVSESDIKAVVLSAHWTTYFNKVNKDSPTNFYSQLSETTTRLTSSGITVYLIDDVPFFSFDPQLCKFRRSIGEEPMCTEVEQNFGFWRNKTLPELTKIADKDPNVKLVRLQNLFCAGVICSMANKDDLFVRDRNHLNINGSRLVGEYISEKYFQKLIIKTLDK